MIATLSNTSCGTPEYSSAISCVLTSFLWMSCSLAVERRRKDLRASGAPLASALLRYIFSGGMCYPISPASTCAVRKIHNFWRLPTFAICFQKFEKLERDRMPMSQHGNSAHLESRRCSLGFDWLRPPPLTDTHNKYRTLLFFYFTAAVLTLLCTSSLIYY